MSSGERAGLLLILVFLVFAMVISLFLWIPADAASARCSYIPWFGSAASLGGDAGAPRTRDVANGGLAALGQESPNDRQTVDRAGDVVESEPGPGVLCRTGSRPDHDGSSVRFGCFTAKSLSIESPRAKRLMTAGYQWVHGRSKPA